MKISRSLHAKILLQQTMIYLVYKKSWSTVDEYQLGICCSRHCWLTSIYSAGVTMEERASTNNFSYLYINLKWRKEKCWRNCKHNHSPSLEANWNGSCVKVCQWKSFHYFVKFQLTKRHYHKICKCPRRDGWV